MTGSSSRRSSVSKPGHAISDSEQNSDLNLINPYAILGFGAALTLIGNEEEIARFTSGVITSALRVQLGAVVLHRPTAGKTSVSGQLNNEPLKKALFQEIEKFFFSTLTDSSELSDEINREIEVNNNLSEAKAAGLNRVLSADLKTIEHNFGMIIAGKSSDEPYLHVQRASLEALASQVSMALHRIQLNRERLENEKALRESEKRLTRILESAMDAIITIDEARRIILFNEAAEKVFLSSSKELIGKRFDRFLSKKCLSLLKTTMQDMDTEGEKKRYMLLPESLTAIRADDEEFPIEATISQFEMYGQKLFTIILRDINERKKAEEELNKLQLEKLYLQEEIQTEHNFEEIIGESRVLKKVLRQVEMVANTDSTVLIRGDTGTGKERIARALHNLSTRKQRPLIKVNCPAIPAGLIESELFGHEKGAFTGAISRKTGKFELADGGTIFLDELGDLPLDAQAKLLRVLQEKEFERVGGNDTYNVDVRVIAATNRDLERAVKEGKFRADLFYRLNVFPIALPNLIERKEDIPLLTSYFTQIYANKLGREIKSISESTIETLKNYSWPGNIRELENIIERAVILSTGETLHINKNLFGSLSEAPANEGRLLKLEENEREHIIRVLNQTNWKIHGESGAAKILGINPNTLRSRLVKLGIKR